MAEKGCRFGRIWSWLEFFDSYPAGIVQDLRRLAGSRERLGFGHLATWGILSGFLTMGDRNDFRELGFVGAGLVFFR